MQFCYRCFLMPEAILKHHLCMPCYTALNKYTSWNPKEVNWIDHYDYKDHFDRWQEKKDMQMIIPQLYFDWDRKTLMLVLDQNGWNKYKVGSKRFPMFWHEKPFFEIRDVFGNNITPLHDYT